jgi:putative ABC transport system permease protein
MTTRQMRRTVVVEAGILGVIGTILGVLAGLAAGALVVLMSGSRVSIAAGLPWGSIALAALLGIGLSMLASWYPARLASRLAIVHAVRQE